MDDLQTSQAQASASTIGAANPLAIAELKLGRTLDPTAADFATTLASALDTPYAQLFDPKFGSVVYAGVNNIAREPVTPVHPITPTEPITPIRPIDVERGPLAAERGPLEAERGPLEAERGPLEAERPSAVAAHVTGASATAVAEAVRPVASQFVAIKLPPWWELLFTDLTYKVEGTFIVDVPTVTSPVQGALGDCWLISAMASVAWCHSDAISERTLAAGNGVVATDGADYEFSFYASSPSWSTARSLAVRVDVPVSSSGLYIYARSSVDGETWPANLEKAFIGMRGATGIFEPSSTNYNELSGGDPAWAVASLVGRAPYYIAAADANAWSDINARCAGGKATSPMTAWTYGTAPAGLAYDDTSGIVGNHAYSILGTETSGGADYVILRNPWGYHPGLVDDLSGAWQGLTLGDDGVFALRSDAFGEYYAAFGGA